MPAGEAEDPLKALEAARKQIESLQARLRAVLATNATLEQQLDSTRSELGNSKRAYQELSQRTAQLEAQVVQQQAWQVKLRPCFVMTAL